MEIKIILKSISYIYYTGSKETKIDKPIRLENTVTEKNCISWCSDKNIDFLNKSFKNNVIIISKKLYKQINKKAAFIVVSNPRYTFKEILQLFDKLEKREIKPTAKIHESVKLGKNLNVGHNVIIEKGCIINDDTCISHNTVIFKNTLIGKKVSIGSNCSIGNIGFGYVKNKKLENELIPHLGKVLISDNVNIGDNVTIDRAVVGNTFIGFNVKIDNLTQIAHGVRIGKNSTILSNVVLAGSVEIGQNSWISFGSAVLNNKKVGNNCTVGVSSTVLKDVKDNQVVLGNPATFLWNNK